MISSADTEFLNIPSTDIRTKDYTIQWICPGRMKQICEFEGGQPTIEIDYRDFVLARWKYWTPYEIRMRANSNFV